MSGRLSLKQRATHAAIRAGLTILSVIVGLSVGAAQFLQWLRLRHLRLKPRPGDIYVATAAKSGTTWMQQIVYQLVTGGRGEFEHIYQVSPFLEELISAPWAERVLDALPSPRILKTHMDWPHLKAPPDSRVIYVTRNAADALVSIHNHRVLNEGYRFDFDTSFFHGDKLVRHWFRHLESWWPHRNDANVLHVRYEDLVADLEGSIRRVARFLGIPIEEERMGDILEKCGFAYMKRHDARFDTRIGFFDAREAGKPTFIRKGAVGDGRTELSPELQAALDSRLAPLREKLGLGPSDV
ncbi:sulfotransferase domain-containing protein [Pyxidicoccus fallax]|uniref:Sulfotransferase domain-containing protein n=1 Tax=Pyxidicoccus fallax TaxID=394095 RepID=A0A848LF28_9BACT|nr:sulfotransferase domain-containing protein [Pyxidicoccus fallax]NMO15465.1 sulfotransferase domain-containing protein [Pyxidicoccus fallax]NPC78730.1 sulfotransferase domain-containing protein [Pyxidicoccus fallax]